MKRSRGNPFQVLFRATDNSSQFEVLFPFKCGDYEPSYMEVHELNGDPLKQNGSLQIGFTLNISIFHRRKKHLSECWIEGNAQHGGGRRRKYFLRGGYSELDEFGEEKCHVEELEDDQHTVTVHDRNNGSLYERRTTKRFEVSLRVGWSVLPEGRPDPFQAITIYPLFINCELSDSRSSPVSPNCTS
ncbi:unnamed protein product [Anisakis simplex]|uniref:TMV resistance protein N-like n=1 Tax=Anisakis simplex TaxID=6269 RepID=A0A0M3JWC3_ANISI|nr:unnamed protein product [Anisakis simplex]